MAKTLQEIIAETEQRVKQTAEATESKHAGPFAGFESGMGKFLQTLTGGGVDYMQMILDNAGKPANEKISVDDVRKRWDERFEARPGPAAAGNLAGHVAQWLPAAKAVSLTAQGMQKAPALAKAGKALFETMHAPGAAAGLKSGAITGATLGTAKEAGRQLDRLGSDESAAQDFHPLGSLGNIAVDTVAGGTGGYVGGQLSQVFPGGQIAKAASAPFSERAMRAARAAEAEGATMGTGNLAGHELARVVADPAARGEMASAASVLEGLTETAARGMTRGRLPQEILAEQGRSVAAGPRSFGSQQGAATRAIQNAEAATVPKLGETLTPLAEDIVQTTPGMAAARAAQVAAARNAAYNAGGGPRATVNAANPSQTPAVLTQLARESTDPAYIAAAERALIEQTSKNTKGVPKPGGGEFAEWYAAQRALQPFDRFSQNLGRQHASPPAQPSPSIGTSLQGGIAGVGKDLLLILRNIAEGTAHRSAGVRNVTQPGSETLAQVGKRTIPQKVIDPGLNSFLQMLIR